MLPSQASLTVCRVQPWDCIWLVPLWSASFKVVGKFCSPSRYCQKCLFLTLCWMPQWWGMRSDTWELISWQVLPWSFIRRAKIFYMEAVSALIPSVGTEGIKSLTACGSLFRYQNLELPKLPFSALASFFTSSCGNNHTEGHQLFCLLFYDEDSGSCWRSLPCPDPHTLQSVSWNYFISEDLPLSCLCASPILWPRYFYFSHLTFFIQTLWSRRKDSLCSLLHFCQSNGRKCRFTP